MLTKKLKNYYWNTCKGEHTVYGRLQTTYNDWRIREKGNENRGASGGQGLRGEKGIEVQNRGRREATEGVGEKKDAKGEDEEEWRQGKKSGGTGIINPYQGLV